MVEKTELLLREMAEALEPKLRRPRQLLELDEDEQRRAERLIALVGKFREVGGQLFAGPERITLSDDAHVLAATLKRAGLLKPDLMKQLRARLRTGITQAESNRTINALPNQYGRPLATIPIVRLDRSIGWFEADWIKATSAKRSGMPRLAWWTDAASWSGNLKGELIADTSEQNVKGTLSGDFEFSRADPRPDDDEYIVRWIGQLNGHSTYKGKTVGPDCVIDEECAGDVKLEVELILSHGRQWWYQLSEQFIPGTAKFLWSDGSKETRSALHQADFGLPALLSFDGSEMPDEREGIGGTSSIHGRINEALEDRVTWRLTPTSGGGGGDEDLPLDPVRGPYVPASDRGRNPYWILLQRLRTPDEMKSWLRYSKIWFEEQVKYGRDAAVAETYRVFNEDQVFSTKYDEVNEFKLFMDMTLYPGRYSPE